MSYQSLGFLAFSLITLILYYSLGKRMQKWVLAIANITFYLIAGVKYLPFLFVTIITTFITAKAITGVYGKTDILISECTENEDKKVLRAKSKTKAKRILSVALLVSIGLLAVCKYALFTVENLNILLTKLEIATIPTFEMILPLGISFYTFMALSYVLDVYWKRYKAESNFIYYMVYLSYFPHVVQGPIDRFNEFKEQIKDGISLNYENLALGAQQALLGFFKKLVIADRLGVFVSGIFDEWQNYSGVLIMASLVIYSIQIYTDFSGCINIVTGISRMFGITLRKNFNHPYFSRTMLEFWRRWHMSLQEWFKDYVYFPVSTSSFMRKIKKYYKNKGKKRSEELFASCFPVFVVWIITGIWHGADWTFVVWGLFHAFLLIGSRVFEPTFMWFNKTLHINTENPIWKLWQMLRTFILCCIGRIFFRASSITQAFQLIERMVNNVSFKTIYNVELITSTGFTKSDIFISAIAILILLVIEIIQENTKNGNLLTKQPLVLRWTLFYILLFIIIIFGVYGPGYNASSFIYEQF